MDDTPGRYAHTWQSKPSVMLLLGPVSVGLAITALLEEIPWPIRVLLLVLSVLAFLAGLGALTSISVSVDADGGIELRKRIAWLPLSAYRFNPGELLSVELDRQVSASGPSGVTGRSGPGTPRFRIDVRHTNGTLLIMASADGTDLKTQAQRLAEALGCPVKRVGSWPI
jgi:hypothetical protein